MKADKRKCQDHRQHYTRHGVYTPYEMNLIETCYFAALLEGLRLIEEGARRRGLREIDYHANDLARFVQAKGVVIYKLQEGI